MRKIIVSVNVTLDGFMAGENGGLDWHFPLWNEEMSEYAYEQLCLADTVLLGRKTYEAMADYYPYLQKSRIAIRSDIAFATHMNDYHKIVFSKKLKTAGWKNASIAKYDLAKEIQLVKSKPGLDIMVYGSASIISELIRLNLIDEYILWVHPVLLGKGKPLFKNIKQRQSLNLLATKAFGTGVVVLYYESINFYKSLFMEKYSLKEDIHVFCVTASSFPEGIMKAHQDLHSLLPNTAGRQFYGISRPNGNGSIVYKAAVKESFDGEAEKYGCEPFVIRKGDYLSEKLTDWKKDENIIGKTFEKLLADPRIDHNGYCLEVYTGENDMICMVGMS